MKEIAKKAEISYEDDYQLVTGNIKEKVSVKTEVINPTRKVVKQITNSHEETKGSQRILVA